jgi:glycine betaine/proline transport system substrate-binding protein
MIGSKKILGVRPGRIRIPAAPGKSADWIANFSENVAAKRWLVMPLWQPQYLNKAHKIRILEEPKQLLGGADRADLVAHKDFRAKVDKRTWEVLQRMSLSVKAVTEMDYLVNVEKVSPRDAARAWIGAHPDTVTHWLESDADE